MKKLMILMAVLTFTGVFAQPPEMEERKEKMNAMRIGFITDALDLSADEAQVFWPVYNEKNNKIENLKKEGFQKMHKLKKEGKSLEALSDKELSEIMTEKLNNEKTIAQLNMDYHKKFLNVIGTKKTFQLYEAEMEFRRELMRKFRKEGKKGDGRPERGGPPPPKD
jgi:hypothetical protein